MAAVVTDAMVRRAWAVVDGAWEITPQLLRDAVTAALTDPRLCKGCTASLADMRVDAVWCSPACKIRTLRRSEGTQTPDPPPRRPGGLQVAFGPAVNHVSKYLSDATPLSAREARQVAERVLTHALSTKQRARRKKRSEAEFREANR